MSTIAHYTGIATNKESDRVNISCTSDGYNLKLEGPAQFGRANEGMTPLNALMCTLAACKCITARIHAEKQGIHLNDINVSCSGVHDAAAFFGDKNAIPGFTEISTTYQIKADNTPEEITQFLKFVDQNCPIGCTLQNPPKMSSTLKSWTD
ncbi:OsmC family protein [Companilactobacillus keshanensis]|uniref:OsmC family protein n=1 Tax=Companilactobacillus keshanensis TaxID=2486003 RepID=A0ABW4BRJ5_9LACO|nr:OsmC family protein [Companilactobacillus keshanensis]